MDRKLTKAYPILTSKVYSKDFACFSMEFNELKFKVIRVTEIPSMNITTNISIKVKPLEVLLLHPIANISILS